MKQLVTFLLVSWLGGLSAFSARAQSTDSLRQYLDQVFAHVDKTQVPAPYLEDYGLHLLPLGSFDGTLTDSSRTTLQAWRLAYASLLTGSVTGTSTLPTLSDLNTRLSTQVAASAAVPIVVQRLDYAALRPDALTAGLFTAQNNQLYDVAGRPASPYVPKVLFMASPARNVVSNGEVSFIFAQNLHVQSGGGTVQRISLDFGDGRGYLDVTWGQPIGASYCAAGTYRVKVRISYAVPTALQTQGVHTNIVAPSRNITFESHFDLEVREPGCAELQTRSAGAARYADASDTVSFPANSLHSGGKVYISYGSAGRTQLTRPLIVAEGYDVSSIAPALQTNYSIENFLNDLKPSGLYYDLQAASNPIPGGITGYDIVFIDFNNGTDDIRRNAALFKEVVTWVNAHKVGGEQNVVLGISMGGLVARYGLAQMERAQPNSTHTRLLITHDSPHRGANTPLGVQALVRQVNATLGVQLVSGFNSLFGKDIFPELFQADALLDAPATQQLLLVRATRSGISHLATFGYEYNSFIANDYQPVVTEDPANPFPYKFIATSLGSQCAQGSLAPYDELFRYTFAGFVSPLPWLRSMVYHTEIVVNALPQPGQVERLSSLRVYSDLVMLSIFHHRSYATNYAFHSPSSIPVAWDGLPGGTQNMKEQLTFQPPTPHLNYGWFVSINGDYSIAGDFCFVPTASAFDVPITHATTTASYVNNITSGPVKPTAVRYIAQARDVSGTGQIKYNVQHPSFPGRQAQWLFNEMQGVANQQACSTECNPAADLTISGPLTLCVGNNGPATYTSPIQGAGYTYTWTASPAYAFTVTSGTSPTFQTANVPGVDESGTITVVVSNGCEFTFSKPIAIGAPAELEIETEEQDDCAQEAALHIVNYDPQLTYAVSGRRVSAIRPDGRFRVSSDSYTISVTNGCGTTTSTRYIDFNPCPNGLLYTVYPNPADNALTVEQTDSTSTGQRQAAHGTSLAAASGPAPSTPYLVRLYDNYGVQQVQQTTTTPTLLLPTGALPTGLYLLHIESNGVIVERRRVQITH